MSPGLSFPNIQGSVNSPLYGKGHYEIRRDVSRFIHAGGGTLVELLVVVAIIATLMSIALPSLARAQKQGEQVACLANQRQLITAWMMYTQGNDDKICSELPQLEDQLEDVEDVFVCPTLEELDSFDNCYGFSNTMGGVMRDGVEPFGKCHHISFAGQRMVIVDKDVSLADCFWPILNLSVSDANEGDCDTEDQWVWRPWSYPSTLQCMTDRHSNGSNMAFADGHCEYHRWRDHRTLKLIKGQLVDSQKASEDNDDLEYLVQILTH